MMRVIFPDGTNQVLERADALAAAKAHDLDLVEVGGRADPPVVKILNYRELERKLQDEERDAARKAREQKKFETPKEMQFSPRIGDHDLEVKMRKCRWVVAGGRWWW
jgi:translation initiation factor IF-3